jgi:membrane-associated phospholipid phosphatase
LLLVSAIAGLLMPGRVRAQDLKQVDSIASRPPAIKLWQVGAVAGAGLLTMALLDEPVQHWVSNPANRSGTINDMASTARHFGQAEVVVPVTAGIIVAGLVTGSKGVFHSGLRIGASMVVATMVTGVAKYAIGVERPYQTGEPGDLDPLSGNSSMWSGHTALAFSFATSLSQEIHRPWTTAGLYTLATATAMSRVYQNDHWVSDVVIGAAVGIASAKLATGRWTIFGLRAPVPLATPSGVGLMWHGTF